MKRDTEERLMRTHVATLFNCDAQGRILSLRRPWSRQGPPPRFFMGRTLTGNVWHFRHDLPDELADELEILCRSEPVAKDSVHPPVIGMAIRGALQARGPIVREYRGPAYVIPEGARAAADAVLITEANSHVLRPGFLWIVPHILADIDIGPVTAAVVDGTAVSICYCARLSPMATEAGVETQEAMRGNGFATAAVAK